MDPFAVGESVPDEAYIEWDVKFLHSNRYMFPLGIREEHLRQCIAESREKDMDMETPDATNYNILEDLVHMEFLYGRLVTKTTWQEVVLILKRGGIVEVLWKTVMVILNCHLRVAITLHGVLNRLQACRGMNTTSLMDRLIQQIMAMGEEVLYVIFLNLHKIYDAFER